MGQQSANRGRPYCDDSFYQTRWENLDSSVSGQPITKKPAETRMGKGKGAPEDWVAVIKPGRILYEMEGVTPEIAKEAMRLAAAKLPIKTKFISRHDQEAAL